MMPGMTLHHVENHLSERTSRVDADPSLHGFEREPIRVRLSALDVVLGAPEHRSPIADRAVRIVRGGAR